MRLARRWNQSIDANSQNRPSCRCPGLAEAIEQYSGEFEGIYYTLNPAVLRIGVRLGVARLFGWCDQSGACPDCVKFRDTLMDQFATYPQSEAEVRSSAPFGGIPPFVLEHDPG